MQELVSIIVPAYNAERFIAQTLQSAIDQSFRNWELLLVDDCSRDGTRTVVREFQARDPRIKLIAQPQNAGPAMARQAGVEAARGRFIAFLDSDDLWLPQKLDR